MALILNLKQGSYSSGVTPETLGAITEFIAFLSTRFTPEKLAVYLKVPNEMEGEKIFEKVIFTTKEMNDVLSFATVRSLLSNNRQDIGEYLERLREIVIQVEGVMRLGIEKYPAYITISNSKLSKTYGSLMLDIFATPEYYSLFEAIKAKDMYFIDELEVFLMKPDSEVKKFIKSCFVLNDNSEKEFPFNASYLYYDSPVGYVNDGFIEIYSQVAEVKKHLSPVKSFLAKKIARSDQFRNFLFEESRAVGMVAQSGSLSIKVIREGALERVYDNIRKRVDSLVKGLPDEDYYENEIEKRFRISKQ